MTGKRISWWRGLFLLCLAAASFAGPIFSPAKAQSEPVLVPDVSQRTVKLQYGFSGEELLLFGAIAYPDGRSRGDDIDIVVILRGPPQSIVVREKRQIAGIWLNADSTEFRSAPAFYAIAASRPLEDIVDERTALIYEFGLANLQLSPASAIDLDEQERFTDGLVDLKRRNALYFQRENGVSIEKGLLYTARLQIPPNVSEGQYIAETFLVQDGRVLAAESREIEIEKQGFERLVAVAADKASFVYGLIAVFISIVFGLGAGLLFQRN
ncbi:TIGR02186 family protein [Parasphingorhabdus sp. DH2-15]|uniref:TIGR02186 family protein n=1 Tax=Parasphingorhabdus sp. DH2-15 TaxID=3444112 RepID=UPI003F6854D6